MKSPLAWRSARRSAYTLMEVVVSLFTVSVLSVGLSSSLFLATRGLSSAENTRVGLDATAGLASLEADIREAKTLTSYTSTQITATVPDRTGDSIDDQVQYTWSGTAGAPLERRINGGVARQVVPDVQQIDIDSRVDTRSTTSTTSFTSSVVHAQSLSGSTVDRELTDSAFFGQFFYPTLPANCISWRPTQVSVQLRKGSSTTSGAITIAVYATAANGWPTPTVVGTGSLDVGSWSTTTYALRDVPITSTMSLSPSQGVTFVVFKGMVPSNRTIQVQSTGASGASGLVSSTDSGATWIQSYTEELRHSVTAQCEVPATTQQTRMIRWLRVQVRSGATSSLTKPMSIEFLNRPQVP